MLTQKKEEKKKKWTPQIKQNFLDNLFFLTEKKLHPPIFFTKQKKNILDRQKIRTQENLKKKVHGNGDTIHICW